MAVAVVAAVLASGGPVALGVATVRVPDLPDEATRTHQLDRVSGRTVLAELRSES